MLKSVSLDTLENLSRLASKPGVQSTLLLSKANCSIINSTGLLASSSSSVSQNRTIGNGKGEESSDAFANGSTRGENEHSNEVNGDTKGNNAEDLARMIFAFVAGAETFAQGMDKSDEVKLLRLRTRKNEIVIYPDPKYLLVVIHDTPPA